MDVAPMDLSEDFIKYILAYILEHCKDDREFLEKRLIDEEKSKPAIERSDMPLREKLKFVIDNNFKRVIISFFACVSFNKIGFNFSVNVVKSIFISSLKCSSHFKCAAKDVSISTSNSTRFFTT